MNYDTTENQNYQGLQNPNSSYSNSQYPSTSPTRVAQAKTAAKPCKKASRNTEERLLDRLFPGKMKNVCVEKMVSNPNKLVKSVGYGAWTQSQTLIYYNYEMPEYLKPFILYHEGLHVIQFTNNGGSEPDTFVQMLNFELFTYKKSDVWINTNALSKKFYNNNSIAADYDTAKSDSKGALDATNKIYIISVAFKIGRVAQRGLNYLLQILSQSNVSAAPNIMTYEEIVFMNMRNATNLPQLVQGKQVYNTKDLYNQTSDPQFYEKFGY